MKEDSANTVLSLMDDQGIYANEPVIEKYLLKAGVSDKDIETTVDIAVQYQRFRVEHMDNLLEEKGRPPEGVGSSAVIGGLIAAMAGYAFGDSYDAGAFLAFIGGGVGAAVCGKVASHLLKPIAAARIADFRGERETFKNGLVKSVLN
jgi:hypothetical protein